jgi:hypothetical protein
MVGGPVFSWRFWPYFRLALTVVDGLEFMDAAFNELIVAPELKERVRAVNEAKGRIYAK